MRDPFVRLFMGLIRAEIIIKVGTPLTALFILGCAMRSPNAGLTALLCVFGFGVFMGLLAIYRAFRNF